jgi:hypothetical protein
VAVGGGNRIFVMPRLAQPPFSIPVNGVTVFGHSMSLGAARLQLNPSYLGNIFGSSSLLCCAANLPIGLLEPAHSSASLTSS